MATATENERLREQLRALERKLQQRDTELTSLRQLARHLSSGNLAANGTNAPPRKPSTLLSAKSTANIASVSQPARNGWRAPSANGKSSDGAKCSTSTALPPRLPEVSRKFAPISSTLSQSTRVLSSRSNLSTPTSVKSTPSPTIQTISRDPQWDSSKGYLKCWFNGKPAKINVPEDAHHIFNRDFEISTESETRVQITRVFGVKSGAVQPQMLATGELATAVATVVVLIDTTNFEKQRFFSRHTAAVSAMAVDSSSVLVASGQLSLHSGASSLSSLSPRHVSPIESTAQFDAVMKDQPTQAHVRIWDAVTLSERRILGLGRLERGVEAIAWSRGPSALLATVDGSFQHTLTTWNWQRDEPLHTVSSSNEPVLAIRFLSTGGLATHTRSGVQLIEADAKSGKRLMKTALFTGAGRASSLRQDVRAIGVDGKGRLVSGDGVGTLRRLDLVSGQVETLKLPGETITSIVRSKASGNALLVGVYCDAKKTTRLLEIGQIAASALDITACVEIDPLHGQIDSIVAFNAGGRILLATRKNALLDGTLASGFKLVLRGPRSPILQLHERPLHNDQFAVLEDGGRSLSIFSFSSPQPLLSVNLKTVASSIEWAPRESKIAVATPDGVIRLFDAVTGKLVHSLEIGGENTKKTAAAIKAMSWSRGSERLAVQLEDEIHILDSVQNKLLVSAKISYSMASDEPLGTLRWNETGDRLQAPGRSWYLHDGDWKVDVSEPTALFDWRLASVACCPAAAISESGAKFAVLVGGQIRVFAAPARPEHAQLEVDSKNHSPWLIAPSALKFLAENRVLAQTQNAVLAITLSE